MRTGNNIHPTAMKRILFALTLITLAIPSQGIAQDNEDVRLIESTFEYSQESFTTYPYGESRVAIKGLGYVPGEAMIPLMIEGIGIYDDETLEDFSCTFENKVLLYDNIDIAIYDTYESLKEDLYRSASIGDIVNISGYLEPQLQGFWKKQTIMINPFEYDATSKSLYLWTKATINVTMRKWSGDYRPFIEDGKEWITGRLDIDWSSGSYEETIHEISRIYFDGDTIVGTYPCKLWMKQTIDVLDDTKPAESKLIAPVFETDRQVFFFYPGETVPRLLYDFQDNQEKKEIELYSIYDESHKAYTFTREKGKQEYNGDSFPVAIRGYSTYPKDFYSPKYDRSSGLSSQNWTEGVGADTSPDRNICISQGGQQYEWYVTSKCTLNGQMLCSLWRQDLTAIHDIASPESANTKSLNSKSLNGQWFDLSGRRLSVPSASSVPSVHPKGVYIRDGKKIVVR